LTVGEVERIQEALKAGMSRLPSGVSIVTSWTGSRPWGTTVSSCTSLSMDPPLLLVCLANGTVSARTIMEQGCFGVNVLAAAQAETAVRAAAPGQPKFIDDLVVDRAQMGSPAIRGALVSIRCELYNCLAVGDHTVLIGDVKDVAFGVGRSPLIYFERGFHELPRSVA